MKKILILGPFPGIIHGQSIANQMLYEGLKKDYKVDKINTFKEKKLDDKSKQGKFILTKFLRIIKGIFDEVIQIFQQKYDIVYMTPGQSFLGFMRFVPYMLISIIVKTPYCIHIHGGHFRKMYNSQKEIRQKLMLFFIKQSKGVIVLGNSLKSMFDGIIENEKIYICENGVQSDIIASNKEIQEKIESYSKQKKKKVIYLSNLMKEKGILELLKASEEFEDNEVEFHLAGAIEPEIEKEVNKYLEKYPNKIKYCGIVKGEKKKEILLENNIFILPSYDEGQPLSILEAYVTGCVVITDENVGGIKDIFRDKKNGLSIKSGEVKEIVEKIRKINLNNYVLKNYTEAKSKYTEEKFVQRIINILERLK